MNLKTLVCFSLITLVTSLSQAARSQTYTYYLLPGNGEEPKAGVTISGDYVYGTAAYGGLGRGTVFEAKHMGTLFDFPTNLPTDRGVPAARVVFGPDGHLYGTTQGDTNYDLGSVFELLPQPTICKTATCTPWQERVLYVFSGTDGAHPSSGDLTWDHQGNIYGTTWGGGANYRGAVYELMPSGNTWTERVIWSFTGPDGEGPLNGVIFDSNGNLFGTTYSGGLYGFGNVFKLTPSGNGWIETSVYDFQGGSDGQNPRAGLTIDNSSNLYGATGDGGNGGGGTVFELTPSGNNYTFNLLYSLSGTPGDSCGPYASLTMDAVGNLWGTTYCDGAYHVGSVFKLANTQNGWIYTSLHDFQPASGYAPISNVTFDSNGNLWGTASQGGNFPGVVWMIKP